MLGKMAKSEKWQRKRKCTNKKRKELCDLEGKEEKGRVKYTRRKKGKKWASDVEVENKEENVKEEKM